MFTGFNLRKLVILTLAFVVAVAISLTVQQGAAVEFDEQIQQIVFEQSRDGTVADVYRILAHLGDSYVFIIACLVLLYFKKTRFSYGFPLAIASLLSVVVQKTVKHFLMRPRPDQGLWLIIGPADSSFPSGHALASVCFFGMLAKLIFYYAENDGASLHFYATPHPTELYVKRSNKIIVCILACVLMAYLISYARIYVGVHWPTDVFAAWFMGIAIIEML